MQGVIPGSFLSDSKWKDDVHPAFLYTCLIKFVFLRGLVKLWTFKENLVFSLETSSVLIGQEGYELR